MPSGGPFLTGVMDDIKTPFTCLSPVYLELFSVLSLSIYHITRLRDFQSADIRERLYGFLATDRKILLDVL